MNNPFVIPLGLAFTAGAATLLVVLVRRIVNFSADQEKAMAEKRIPREEARRNAVLSITCGAIIFLALLNLSVTYVKAFRYHLERSAQTRESTSHDACAERLSATACARHSPPALPSERVPGRTASRST